MKKVQIDYDLFKALVMYHLGNDAEYQDEINEGLQKKMDAMLNRELYSKSKTAETENEREQARLEYLDRKGVPKSFRW